MLLLLLVLLLVLSMLLPSLIATSAQCRSSSKAHLRPWLLRVRMVCRRTRTQRLLRLPPPPLVARYNLRLVLRLRNRSSVLLPMRDRGRLRLRVP